MAVHAEPRQTPRRRAVLDVLRASEDHPSAADVYERVRRTTAGIGAATVYRTLALLVATGQARELSLGDGNTSRYDGNTNRHDHLVCYRCHRAVDIDVPVPDGLVPHLADRTGFAIISYDLQFHGLCPTCRTTA